MRASLHRALIGALAVALCAAAAFALCACGANKQQVSPYNWDNLVSPAGRFAYSDGTYFGVTGIDVSESQGAIDWEAVAQDGVEFAFVRLGNRGTTEGGLYADDCYAQNLDDAAGAGLAVGAYFYSQATSVSEAMEEAAFALELLDGRTLDLPVAFDWEASMGGRLGGIDAQTAAQCARAFCQCLNEAGYQTALYGNASDLLFFGEDQLESGCIWLAEYTDGAPASTLAFTFWQYSSTSSVAGIEGPVDMDLWMRRV